MMKRAQVNPSNVHGYVLGEHGDSSFVPWSLVSIAGMELENYDEKIFKMFCFDASPTEDTIPTIPDI